MLIWCLSIVSFVIIAVLVTSYICFREVFYISEKEKQKRAAHIIPNAKASANYRNQIIAWQEQMDLIPHETVQIKSFDGLTLSGIFYEFKKGAPVELMLHGYKGNSRRNFCGAVIRASKFGHNVLLIDQRGNGKSDGHTITFGIKESRDAVSWINYLEERFGNNIEILLAGVSMGAATALMSIERGLPSSVKWIIADCGYSTPKAIMKDVAKKRKLPATFLYPFIRLGALLFGRFDPEEITPLDAVKKSPVPILFVHGDTDAFVPCYMSEENYNACTSKKKLLIIKGASHGLAYYTSPDEYENAIRLFFELPQEHMT